MQVNGPEERDIVHGALKKFGKDGYYEDKLKFISEAHLVFGDDVVYWPYEVNDLKMAHLLLGKCNYNRQHGSNLLCNCSKRVGVKENETHQCRMMTDEEQLQYYNKAQAKLQELIQRCKDAGEEIDDDFIVNEINSWAADHNGGITGFGIHPSLLPISRIRPDVMHMMMGIVKRILTKFDSMLSKHTDDVQDQFNACINTFLLDHQVYIWKLGGRISKYLGDELKTWGESAATIAEWIEKQNLHRNSKEWTHMCEALKLWPDLQSFMLKAKVGEKYLEEVAEFERNVKMFYAHGGGTFMVGDNGEVGRWETSYLHLLRYNLGELARITYNRHKLGIGIFTLQGVSVIMIIVVHE